MGIDLDLFKNKNIDRTRFSAQEKLLQKNIDKDGQGFKTLQHLPLLEEAAISHMIEKVDNIPKIKFQMDEGSSVTLK